jgi:hypothetical protein
MCTRGKWNSDNRIIEKMGGFGGCLRNEQACLGRMKSRWGGNKQTKQKGSRFPIQHGSPAVQSLSEAMETRPYLVSNKMLVCIFHGGVKNLPGWSMQSRFFWQFVQHECWRWWWHDGEVVVCWDWGRMTMRGDVTDRPLIDSAMGWDEATRGREKGEGEGGVVFSKRRE